MADRGAANVFGRVFTFLASDPSEKNRIFAKSLWRMSLDFDFHPYQLYCDEELEALGLARVRDSEHGKIWCYGPEGEELS